MNDQANETATNETAAFAIGDEFTLSHRKAVSIKAGEIVDVSVTLEKYTAEDGEEKKTGFRAAFDGHTIDAETEGKLIDAIVAHAAGIAIKKATKANPDGYTVNAVDNPNGKSGWQSVKNDAEPELSEDDTARLAEIATDVNEMFADNVASAKASRQRAIRIGKELQEARNLFQGDADTDNSKAAWGRWVKTSFPAILKRAKNFVAEHMKLAQYPSEYWTFADESKASAKALEAWHNANRSAFAAHAAETFVGQKVAKDNKAVTQLKKLSKEKSFADICKDTANGKAFLSFASELKADQETAFRADFEAKGYDLTIGLNVDGKNALAIALAATYVELSDMAKYFATSLEKELFEIVNAKSDAEKAEEDKQNARESVTATARGFVNFTPSEAAEHIARILMSRDDCFEVLDMVEATLERVLAEEDETKEAEESAAENSDQKATG